MVRSIVSFPAGFARVRFYKFIGLSLVGMAIWDSVWVLVGAYFFDAYQKANTLIWITLLLLVGIAFWVLRADQQIEAQREPSSLRGPKGRGNPVSRVDCHVASLLAMTTGLI
jgi:membrane protein DedA with SNARE-associated domain